MYYDKEYPDYEFSDYGDFQFGIAEINGKASFIIKNNDVTIKMQRNSFFEFIHDVSRAYILTRRLTRKNWFIKIVLPLVLSGIVIILIILKIMHII